MARVDERSGHPTWAEVEELETTIERLENEVVELEETNEESRMSEKNSEYVAATERLLTDATIDRDRFSKALNDIEKANRAAYVVVRSFADGQSEIPDLLEAFESFHLVVAKALEAVGK